MFKVFDRKKKQVDLLENPISPVITNELGGIGELTFSVPSTYKHLELEGYIQVENDHEYVIKEIVTHGTNRDVVCMLNIEEILGMAWSKFISRDNTLMKCAELVLSGTGWRAVDNSSCNVKRNLYGTVTNSYNLLQMMCTVYNVEFIFDTYNKVVTFVDKVGRDAGVYFMKDINLKQLNVDTHTHKYITRVIPVGKNGLTIESVNNGKNYLENKTYTTKNIYGIWQSDKHDNPQALMDDARRFLDEMAIPYETYEVVVDDLYALKGYEEFEYGLGDIVTIIDGDTETRIQQRVIQRTYNLLEPDKDTIHIANKDATFEDYYKRLQTIADMTQSVIGSDGSINGGSISDGTISGDKIENDSINSGHISSGSITSTHIKAEQILADHIMSNQITTNHLVANSITSDHIQANSIDTKHLKANTITSDHIQSNTINSNHISANTITSGHIQSGAITAGSGIIAEGAIGNAQISKIDAGKIEAGTIDTSKVTIQGANGHLRLKGNRMQVFNGVGNQAKERVSVGDVNGDGTVYGLRVRGADGQTILLDENGVTSEGITDGAITNDKISEDANIDGAKLNINSVINKINTDGTEIIQGTKIEVDGTNLGVKLSEITNKQTSDGERITQAQSQITANQNAIKLKVDEQVYTSDKKGMTSKLEKNTSEISTLKGQIALKVEQTDIENAKNELTGIMDSKISSAKSELKVTTDKISQTVSNLSQTVSTKADNSVVTSMNNKVSSLETSVNGISGSVSSLEKTTTTLGTQVNTANTNASSALNKANSATTTANNAQNTANTNKSNITNLQGEVNTVKNNVASLEITTSGISQKVSSVESTTATLSGKVNTANNNATNALNKANSANTLADSKAKVFTTTPTVPYKVGDLWVQGTSGDVMKCKTARASGSYTASDWEKASKYTDDTKANAVDGKVTTLQGTVNTTNSKVATLETNLSSITSRVSNVENTTTTINGNITNLQSRMNSAEQKITSDAIVNTVKQHTTNGSATFVQNSVFTQTVNGINSTVSSKTDKASIISTINQSAEDVTINASKIKLEGTTTVGGQGRHIRIKENDICMYENATEYSQDLKLEVGFQENELKSGTYVPKIRMGCYGMNPDAGVIDEGNYVLIHHMPKGANPHDSSTDAFAITHRNRSTNNWNGYRSFGNGRVKLSSLDADVVLEGKNGIKLNSDTYYTYLSGTNIHVSNKLTVGSLLYSDTLNCRAFGAGGSVLMHSSLDGNNKNLGYSGSKFNQVSAKAVWGDTGSWSDKRTKENIRYLDNEVSVCSDNSLTKSELHNFIKELHLCEYNYKEEFKSYQNDKIGFIANDVVGDKVGDKIVTEHEGFLTYNLNNMLFTTIGALQEEIRKREELENKCANLEERLAKLEKLMGGM